MPIEPQNMPTIGVAGVTIPGAVDCIQKINRSSPSYFTNNEHPHIVLYQPNFGTMQSALQNGEWDKVLLELIHSVKMLAQMGADFAIIPANTVHKVISELQRQSAIPVLNMLEIVCSACKEKGIKRVGVLGTLWTMSNHLYKKSLEANGIEEVIPSDAEQQIIHRAIFSELIPTGSVSSATLSALLGIASSLKQRDCEGIVLACTELPLVLNASNCGMCVIDSTDVLAKAALEKAAKIK